MVAMSAESVGRHMPETVTLDDLAAMMESDPVGRRYELSPEGVLTVMPPPTIGHVVTSTKLMFWLGEGWPKEQIGQAPGLWIPGDDGAKGARLPDLALWNDPRDEHDQGNWLSGAEMLLAVEIVSKSSKTTDKVIKYEEYAAAGVKHYWIVDLDADKTVTMYRLGHGGYATADKMPLAEVLECSLKDFLD
jgi:Uma2 family endonuclease